MKLLYCWGTGAHRLEISKVSSYREHGNFKVGWEIRFAHFKEVRCATRKLLSEPWRVVCEASTGLEMTQQSTCDTCLRCSWDFWTKSPLARPFPLQISHTRQKQNSKNALTQNSSEVRPDFPRPLKVMEKQPHSSRGQLWTSMWTWQKSTGAEDAWRVGEESPSVTAAENLGVSKIISIEANLPKPYVKAWLPLWPLTSHLCPSLQSLPPTRLCWLLCPSFSHPTAPSFTPKRWPGWG